MAAARAGGSGWIADRECADESGARPGGCLAHNKLPIANVLMNLARAPADALHTTMAAVIEERAEAADLLAKLGR
jgi:hypothetical protein